MDVVFGVGGFEDTGAGRGGPRIDDADIDSNSGVISRLQRVNGSWIRDDLVRGLPRSKADHATNGIVLTDDQKTLYVLQGANTNLNFPADIVVNPANQLLAANAGGANQDLGRFRQPPRAWPSLLYPLRSGSSSTYRRRMAVYAFVQLDPMRCRRVFYAFCGMSESGQVYKKGILSPSHI